MEALAYLHLALAYEAPASQERVDVLPSLSCFHWQQISGKICLHALSVSLSLVVLSAAGYASTLQWGDSGAEVLALQQRLQSLGYLKDCATGNFQEMTQEAVIQFQQDRGLVADGVVGSQTQAALGMRRTTGTAFNTTPFTASASASTPTPSATLVTDETNPQTTLQRGSSDAAVSDLQQDLKLLGFYNGPITGYYGSITEEAIAKFQQANNLRVTGIYDSATQNALQNRGNIAPSTQASVSRSIRSSNSNGLLRRGDRAQAVTELQYGLRVAGYYNGPATGEFDLATEEALIQFQQASGISPDGIYGPITQKTLQERGAIVATQQVVNSSSKSTLQHGDSGSEVTNLQSALTVAGFYDGPITGYFGSLTEEALINFQQAKGIKADGIAGIATQAALQNYSRSSSVAERGEEFTVVDLQERLRSRGLYDGPIDGILGPQTQAAIEAAQRRYLVSESDIANGRF